MEKRFIAVDIGGTTIKADLYDKTGNSLNHFVEVSTAINLKKGTNNILQQVDQIIEDYMAQASISGLAISSAGVVNPQKGEIVYSGYTIPGYTGSNFYDHFASKYQIPVFIDNDVNCAALGEYWLGAAKESDSIFMITIGTGIGGSFILNGKIVTGHRFTAGEVGYLPIRGTDWQKLASTGALLSFYKDYTGEEIKDGKVFFQRFDLGELAARKVLDMYLDYLVEGLLTLSYVTNPRNIIVGGGIMARHDVIIPMIKEKLKEKAMDVRFLPERILPAALGNEAGRIGALFGLLNKLKS